LLPFDRCAYKNAAIYFLVIAQMYVLAVLGYVLGQQLIGKQTLKSSESPDCHLGYGTGELGAAKAQQNIMGSIIVACWSLRTRGLN